MRIVRLQCCRFFIVVLLMGFLVGCEHRPLVDYIMNVHVVRVYIDEEIKGTVTDLHGVTGSYHELSYIHLEKAPFRLSLADEYADYIQILTGGMKR